MDEVKVFFGALAILVIGAFATGIAITKLDNDAIVKMVGDGANPIAARCAVSGKDSILCNEAAKVNAQIQALALQVEAMRLQSKGL